MVRCGLRSPLFLVGVTAFVVTAAHRISHIVVVMEENRSFDHLLGWRSKGSNGLTGKEYNLLNDTDPTSEKIYVTKNANNVAKCDPNHDLWATTTKIFGTKEGGKNPPVPRNSTKLETMQGFVATENNLSKGHREWSHYCGVLDMFSPEHLPVTNALADEFVLMDNFFASVPGPTWPNRLFFLSGTSGGLTETNNPWFRTNTGVLFPQKTIYDQIREAGLTWKNYVNDTPWELMLESVAHYPENVVLLENFFRDCETGNLPSFSFINPRAGINFTTGLGSNDQHPNHDVSLGEALIKDVYEAVRASPKWEETLLIVTYDEHGGFYDHVAPPMEGVPDPGDGLSSYPDEFDFKRLGMRIVTLLVSPWVPKGLVVSEPAESAKPTPTSQFELTSIMATVRKLLNIDGHLTERDKWAATFDYVLNLTTPREDCPIHLPDPMPPTQSPEEEAALPVNSLQHHMMRLHEHLRHHHHTTNAPSSSVSAGDRSPLYDQCVGEVPPVPAPGVHEEDFEPICGVALQADVSPFLQEAFAQHKEGTRRWKASKKWRDPVTPPTMNLTIRCAPFIAKEKDFYVASNWTITLGADVPYRTIAIKTDRHATEEWCLDSGTHSHPDCDENNNCGFTHGTARVPQDGDVVGVSLCYPSANYAANRDVAQHWLFLSDTTIRPVAAPHLCLTNECIGNTTLKTPGVLRACRESDGYSKLLTQRWAYQGPAVGNMGWYDGGMLSEGDAIYALVVDKV